MECGRLTAKLRDAVPVCFIEEGREIKRIKNIEIPDEIRKIEYKDFKFDMPETGNMTFKIYFAPGSLPTEWPALRERKHRVKTITVETAMEITDGNEAMVEDILETALEQGYAVGDVKEPPMMEVNYNVNGVHRKELVEAIADLIDEKPRYLGLPSYSFQIGPYEVSKTGLLAGPSSKALIAWLHDKGFDAE